MDAMWTELRAAIERLNRLQDLVADLKRQIRELQQQLKNARGL